MATKKNKPANWKEREKHPNWDKVSCDDCGKFIHWVHNIVGQGVEGYYDENGNALDDGSAEYSTDSFAEYLRNDIPTDYDWLCEACFNNWKKK